jgi:UDP-glucose-4-epimerase GalE
MRKTILVTGGAGYIGSHACKALSAAGYTPVTLDNMVYGHPWAVKWGPLIHGDIADGPLLDTIFKEYAPEAVMHFAAYAYVGESVSNPAKYYHNNVAGTLSILEAMRNNNCASIVFSSTCAVYGTPKNLPITETTPQHPMSPYGWSKYMVERILKDFDKAHGIKYASLRYFNAAGADPELEIGEEHDPETHLIPLVLAAARERNKSITVFGSDYDTPDGTCIRDYVHVADLADAHVSALKILQNKKSVALNLGTGHGYSVREVIDTARRVTDVDINEKIGDRREGDPPKLVADNAEALATLGWEAQYCDLETIIRHAWEWMKKSKAEK